MTFEQLSARIYTAGEQVQIWAFDSEDCLDEFAKTGNTEGVVFVHCSDLKPSATLLDKWCKAEVQMIYAVKKDVFAVQL